MAGLGGKGVLLAGQLLAKAALPSYEYVSWTPTYFAIMRSGACECTVILSQEEPGAPVLPKADVVIVFEPSQLAPFEGRVRSGGTLIAESAGLPEVKRDDIKLEKVPAVEISAGLGNPQAANFVLLGAYVGLTGAIPTELVETELEQTFTGREEVLRVNKEAFGRGLDVVAGG